MKSSDRSNYTVHSNTIKDNIISETNYAIYLEGTSNTEVINNVIQDFGTYGVDALLSTPSITLVKYFGHSFGLLTEDLKDLLPF